MSWNKIYVKYVLIHIKAQFALGREKDRQNIDDPSPSQRVTHTTGMTHLKVALGCESNP